MEVPRSTIRYWETTFQDLVKPERTNGGQRRYSKSDVANLLKIKNLLHTKNKSIDEARDILKQGIIAIYGPETRNTHTLIQNQQNENIGYGIIMRNKIIKNIADIGDLLRRENHTQKY